MLKNKNFVYVEDYRAFDPETCNNGGGYGYKHQYTRQAGSEFWEPHHSFTGDFPYCEKFGTFDDCQQCRHCNTNGECTVPENIYYVSSSRLEIILDDLVKAQDAGEDVEVGIYNVD